MDNCRYCLSAYPEECAKTCDRVATEIVAGLQAVLDQWRAAIEYLRGRKESPEQKRLLAEWDMIAKEIDNA